jgi:hypothetical protein
MDNPVTARLIQSRIESIRADLGPGIEQGGGGSLRTKVRASIQENENVDQAVAEVFIEVTGVPEKSNKASEFAFQISLIEQGLYEWPPGTRPADLDDLVVTRSLCQPIFTVAIAEIAHLAQRMGFNSVRVGWSLPMNDVKKATPKKRQAIKQAAKPASAKLAKVKK